MTILKVETTSVEDNSIPRKAVAFKAKYSLSAMKEVNVALQSSNKRRRFQRRNSKVPSMFLAGFDRQRKIDGMELIEIQRRLLEERQMISSSLPKRPALHRAASLDLIEV